MAVCSAPRRLPAPRISRSRMAILKPLPRSVNSRIAWRRFPPLPAAFCFCGTSERHTPSGSNVRHARGADKACDRPRLSASWMIIVLTLEISSPVSMIVVDTSTSISPLIKSYMIFSSSRSFICPCANATLASGTSDAILFAVSTIVLTRL